MPMTMYLTRQITFGGRVFHPGVLAELSGVSDDVQAELLRRNILIRLPGAAHEDLKPDVPADVPKRRPGRPPKPRVGP